MADGGMNMADMFSSFMDMQRKVTETQEALALKSTTAEAGGGMVTVTANGNMRITSIKLEKDAVDLEDLEVLEDLVVAGVNKALEQAAELAKEEMNRAAGSLLPPGFDMSKMGF